MQVATSTLKLPAQKSASTCFCSFCFMPPPDPFSLLPGPCPMNALQAWSLSTLLKPQHGGFAAPA